MKNQGTYESDKNFKSYVLVIRRKHDFDLFTRLNTSNAAYHYTFTLNESQKMHTAIKKHLTLHYSQSTFFHTLLNLEKPPLAHSVHTNSWWVGFL